jgi:hypothetical protein
MPDPAGITYELRVTFDGVNPPIWYMLTNPTCIALSKLHIILRLAVNWMTTTSTVFCHGKVRYSPPNSYDDDFGTKIKDDAIRILCILLKRPTQSLA